MNHEFFIRNIDDVYFFGYIDGSFFQPNAGIYRFKADGLSFGVGIIAD